MKRAGDMAGSDLECQERKMPNEPLWIITCSKNSKDTSASRDPWRRAVQSRGAYNEWEKEGEISTAVRPRPMGSTLIGKYSTIRSIASIEASINTESIEREEKKCSFSWFPQENIQSLEYYIRTMGRGGPTISPMISVCRRPR